MKNIICILFAYDQNKQGGVNVNKEKQFEVYTKKFVVGLVSAKKYNPNDTVALVTNLNDI